MRTRHAALAALTTAGLMWGTTVPLTKLAVGWLGPGWLTVVRFTVAALLLAGPARRHLRAALTPAVLGWGAVGYGLVIVLQNAGVARTSVSHAALLVGTTPVFVAFIALGLGRGRAGALSWIGFAAALGGVGLVALDGGGGATRSGDGMVLVALLLSATYVVAQPRLLAGRDPVAVTAVQLAAGALVALPIAGWFDGAPPAPPGPVALLVLAGLILGGTLVPFTLFAIGQSRVTPEVAGAFLNLEPLVGVVAGALAFGDPLGVPQVLGGTAILGGIALSAAPLLRTRPAPARRPTSVRLAPVPARLAPVPARLAPAPARLAPAPARLAPAPARLAPAPARFAPVPVRFTACRVAWRARPVVARRAETGRCRSGSGCARLGAVEQQRALAGVAGQRRGALELRARLLGPADPGEQVAAHAGEEMVVAQRGLGGERVEDVQAAVGAVGHGDGYRAVELHDRSRGEPGQSLVERGDPAPVGVVGAAGLGVTGGDRGLEDVGADRAADPFGAQQREVAAPDEQLVPAAAVLFEDRDGFAVRTHAGPGPRGLDLHERDQAVHLGLVGREFGEHAAEAQRLVAERGPHPVVTRGRRVPLIEDQINHFEYRSQPLRPLRRWWDLERDAAVRQGPLGPDDPLRHGRLGYEEGPRDLLRGQTAENAQGERDARLGGQRRMAGGEDQP
jgi:drug/metabolite transporter (DMT)-like permease